MLRGVVSRDNSLGVSSSLRDVSKLGRIISVGAPGPWGLARALRSAAEGATFGAGGGGRVADTAGRGGGGRDGERLEGVDILRVLSRVDSDESSL